MKACPCGRVRRRIVGLIVLMLAISSACSSNSASLQDAQSAADAPADQSLSDGHELAAGDGSSDTTSDQGPDPDAGGDAAEAEVVEVRMPGHAGIIAALAPKVVLPFPWNWSTREDLESPTGLRVDYTTPHKRSAAFDSLLVMFPYYATEGELLDGFGSLGMIFLPVNTAVDPQTLPELTGPGEPIQVFHLSPDSGFVSVPFRVEYHEYNDVHEQFAGRAIVLDPLYPLKERSRYLVCATRDLVDAGGQSFEPFPLTEAVLGLRAPFGSAEIRQNIEAVRDETLLALEQVAEAPFPEDLAVALVYTVGTMVSDMAEAAALIEKESVEYDLDPDGDGTPNVYGPGGNPLFSAAPPNVGVVVTGRFQVPDFRNPDGYIVMDSQGHVSIQDYQWRDFFLVIPEEGELEPFPVATLQHGLNSWKETMLQVARGYALQGIASAGFDFIHHKKGTNGGLLFASIDHPRRAADNFRQSALDILSFDRALTALVANEDLHPLGGDGQPDLDTSAVALSGHSLGAVESSIACTLSTRDRVGGFVNGGGDFQYVFEGFFDKYGLLEALPQADRRNYMTIATVLRNLENRGLVTHSTRKRSFVFRPVQSREEVREDLVHSLLNRAFSGCPRHLVSSLLEAEKMTPEELAELRALIAAKEQAVREEK